MSWASHTGGGASNRHRAQKPAAAQPGASGEAAAKRGDGERAKDAERATEVHLDGLVVLKIIKHCRDAFPENVAGTLLGFEKDDGQGGPVSGTLEVTHAFPMPMDDSEDANVGYDQRYEVRMIKALKEVRSGSGASGANGWGRVGRERRAAEARARGSAPAAGAAAASRQRLLTSTMTATAHPSSFRPLNPLVGARRSTWTRPRWAGTRRTSCPPSSRRTRSSTTRATS